MKKVKNWVLQEKTERTSLIAALIMIPIGICAFYTWYEFLMVMFK